MLKQVNELVNEFRIATEKRIGKTERHTLENNYKLTERLSNFGNRLIYLYGKNKSYQEVNLHVNQDVKLFNEIQQQMQKKLDRQINSLKVMLDDCSQKEKNITSLLDKIPTNNNLELLFVDAETFSTYLVNLVNKEEVLKQEVEDLRIKVKEIQMSVKNEEEVGLENYNKLNNLCSATNRLNQLVTDCQTAFVEANEIFDPSNTDLSFTERTQRRDHLLTALFTLLYTKDRLGDRITPHQIGDYRLDNLFHSIKLYGKSKSATSHIAYPDYHFHDKQFRKTDKSMQSKQNSSKCIDSVESNLDSQLSNNNQYIHEFNLIPNKKFNFNRTLIKLASTLSIPSTITQNRIFTRSVNSIGVQTDIVNHIAPFELCPLKVNRKERNRLAKIKRILTGETQLSSLTCSPKLSPFAHITNQFSLVNKPYVDKNSLGKIITRRSNKTNNQLNNSLPSLHALALV